ncbi:HAD family hydrolase [Flavisolibacter tropicus]|uniref:Haloacid dehalogenase n=1 Tax=Flavisolibacter tropicus TaxID=1492898 RepID=A0A172TZ10_9BACT|nr:HAD family hydrolase [Flavisolibacter tropicus]ANE52339.1 haloacid dehalogenase [Flavisolibacter tropicus]
MAKKAIILDLDNTIYSVASIGEKLFASLFQQIDASGLPAHQITEIKDAVMREPFQVVVRRYQFDHSFLQTTTQLLQGLTYNEPIDVFPDYHEIKQLPADRFLVTTGFKNLQTSKIKNMGIEQDFKEIHIVDPNTGERTKKTVFADILQRYNLTPSDALVVGDDPESEIKAGTELGIDTVLYDKFNRYPTYNATNKISDFKELNRFI